MIKPSISAIMAISRNSAGCIITLHGRNSNGKNRLIKHRNFGIIELSALREKYDLHMTAKRFVSDDTGADGK